MSSKFSDMIIEGLNRSRVDAKDQILKTEGTTSSDIATPDGKVGSVKIKKDKEFLCPSCGGKDVIIKDGKFHCTGCENEWGVEANESKAACVKGDAFSKVSFALDKYAGYKECELHSLDTGRNNDITSIGIRVNSKNVKAMSLVKDFGFVKGNIKAHSRDVPTEGQEDYVLRDSESIMNFLKFLNKETKQLRGVITYKDLNERKSISVSEDSVNEASKYRVGKKFTSPDMDFEVKKINKNGTINIWVEQDNKSYDVEISDLELLRPVEVKE